MVTSNPEAALISAVCNNRDIDALMRENVIDMFVTHKDVAMSAIAYYNKYGTAPTTAVLSDRFREFEPCETDSPTPYYIDRLRESFLRSKISDALVAAGRSIDSTPPSKLLSALNQTVNGLVKYSTQIKDVNLVDYGQAIEHYDAVRSRTDDQTGALGIRSGIKAIDSSLPTGFAPGHLVIMLGYSGRGKAESVHTVIPTPNGPVRFGSLRPGDLVFGADGKPQRILQIHPQGRLQGYTVRFCDGTESEFSIDHLWEYFDGRGVRNVASLGQMIKFGISNPRIKLTQAVEYPAVQMPSTFPYFLGVTLASDTSNNQILINGSYVLKSSQALIISAGSIEQRKKFIAGVLDAAGVIVGNGVIIDSQLSEHFSVIAEIARSLGYYAKFDDDELFIIPSENPFFVPSKASVFKPETNQLFKKIVSIEKSSRVTMMCITVENYDSLYLTADYTVTHNTWLSGYFAVQAFKQGKRPMIVSMEMTAAAMRDRLYATMGNGVFSMSDFQTGLVDPDDFSNWAEQNVGDRQDFILVSPDGLAEVSPDTIQAKINQYRPDMVVVDYIQLMSDGTGSRNETEKVRNISKALKSIAMRNNIPVIAISAVTSPDLSAPDGPPMLEQVSWSRSIQYDADLAIAVHQHDDSQIVEIVSRKNRHGPDFAAWLEADFSTGRIEETFDL